MPECPLRAIPGVPIVAQCVKNLTSLHEDAGSIPGLQSGVSVAVAPTGPLAWEPPYTAGVALESKKKFL